MATIDVSRLSEGGMTAKAAEDAYNAAVDSIKKTKNPTQTQINALKDASRTKTALTPASAKIDPVQIVKDAQASTQTAVDEALTAIKDVNEAGRQVGYLTGQKWDDGESDTSMSDAYQRLYDEFNGIGLGALVADAKDLLMKATSISAMPDALRNTKAYTERFSANDARIKAGLSALSPAAYLAKEDKYQEIMRQYGLPPSYYTTGLYGKQEGFDKLLANDISSVELEDRLITAQQRVLNSNPEVLKAIKDFYGDSVTNGDILAYALDPSKAIEDIKKKVTAAEIQGAANVFGLNQITKESTPAQVKALEARAAALAGQGIDKEAALAGFETVSDITQRGSQLAEIYKESPYTQGTAEAEVFKTAGAAEAKAKRKRLAGKETASFSGSSGVGALGRDRATNYGTTQSGFGQY
jgi:hypothetical protein